MKKIYESIILRTEDYTVVDLKKEYTDPVGGIQFVIISESSEQELLQRFGDGLVNICIVEKITKFDNDIFLDFRAAGKSFAGSTIRLRMACT